MGTNGSRLLSASAAAGYYCAQPTLLNITTTNPSGQSILQSSDPNPTTTPKIVCYGDQITLGTTANNGTNFVCVDTSLGACGSVGASFSSLVPTSSQPAVRFTIWNRDDPYTTLGQPIKYTDAVYLIMLSVDNPGACPQDGNQGSTTQCGYNYVGWFEFEADYYLPQYFAADQSFETGAQTFWFIDSYANLGSTDVVMYGDSIAIRSGDASYESEYIYDQVANGTIVPNFQPGDFSNASVGSGEWPSAAFSIMNGNQQIPYVTSVLTSCNGGGSYICDPTDPNCVPGQPPTCSNGCTPIPHPDTCLATCPTSCAAQGPCAQGKPPVCTNGNRNPTCDPKTGLWDCTFAPTSSTEIVLGVVFGIVAAVLLALLIWSLWRWLFGKKK